MKLVVSYVVDRVEDPRSEIVVITEAGKPSGNARLGNRYRITCEATCPRRHPRCIDGRSPCPRCSHTFARRSAARSFESITCRRCSKTSQSFFSPKKASTSMAFISFSSLSSLATSFLALAETSAAFKSK